ncbi:MAG: AAA family ATPase [Chloroflexota bacterium]|nr:AAA family ATPase [Chloroflexota bacterium]MDE2960281.1 AAA family ATPase [Chloroflexota bacterium]
MLTKLTVRNFKQFEDVTVELDNVVVFVGPNDSGKTTALQALSLWGLGLRRWRELRGTTRTRPFSPGGTINRLDLLSVPVRQTNLLWRGLQTRRHREGEGRPSIENVRIEIIVEGVSSTGEEWVCGLAFGYANPESIYCRPLRIDDGEERMAIPNAALEERVVFLPPMSGLSSTEVLLQPGAVNVLIGEGRTAEVLRNLCYEVYQQPGNDLWNEVLTPLMQKIFGATVLPPQYNSERGEITLHYKDAYMPNRELDLSSSGRGFQQTLLLAAYMLLNPNSVVLLDEPDAHLEVLRQREIYQAITETAEQQRSQLVIATHSEIILNEAAGRHTVTAFIGTPHRMDGRSSQVFKALSEIGFEHYLQARQKGWVLYLEGSTDLAILQAFSRRLQHPAEYVLTRPYVHYVGNQPMQARQHFWGLREALPSLKGYALFDRLDRGLPSDIHDDLQEYTWAKREIENYFCSPKVLERWVESGHNVPLSRSLMVDAIEEIESALQTVNLSSPWDGDLNVSEQFLPPVFTAFYKKLGEFNTMSKSDYHTLVDHIEPDEIDLEVIAVLDAIAEVADSATVPR